MAVAAPLSPWPTADPAEAIARLKVAIAGRAAESDEAAAALGAMASARVEREAPGAPQSIRDEATIRYSGYMSGSDYGAIRAESIGPRSVDYIANHGAMWRRCGAAGLLAPWRVRVVSTTATEA